ncbi:SDR family oxidoreductase [Streptomyces herbicida]|uniref:SDR family oxidoreductase n=1 Tax=Streptomyces herbicida TaxID=3065675 RepID=UPI0029305C96|nr:SDR family oxidoreductase [Streptomyces sp. NEAU-HV9]
MEKITLVTGATGNLGGHVVARLMDRGGRVRALSRRHPATDDVSDVEWCQGDLSTGEGLERALEGVGTVVHCATDGRTRNGDVAAARHLLRAADEAGGPHVLFVSIIGVDRHPLGYYRAKYDTERLVETSGLPYTILRAAQFHDMLHYALHRAARLPVMPVLARTGFQSVDTGHVAARAVELSTGGSYGRVADLPGPDTLTMADMARIYLRVTGRRRPILPLVLPGSVPRAYRQGLHLAPAPQPGSRCFEQFLRERPSVKVPEAARKAAR